VTRPPRPVHDRRAATTSTPLGALFEHTFSRPQRAIELFRSVLPPALLRCIDFDTLEMEPVSFIGDASRAQYSDLLFRVWLDGEPAYLYLLFEHQGRPGQLTGLRLLCHGYDTWDHHSRKHPRDSRLPVVIPIALHHGEDGWTEPVSLRALYDARTEVQDELGPFLHALTFLFDDLSHEDDDATEERAHALWPVPQLMLWTFKYVLLDPDALQGLRDAKPFVDAILNARAR
jgi:predicted transposase YdaD